MKTALVLALAAAVAADKISLRLARYLEKKTESVSTETVLTKFKLDIPALQKEAAGAANPHQYLYDTLKKTSDENLKTLAAIVDVKDVKPLWIAGAFAFPNATKATVDKLAASNSVIYLDLNAKDYKTPKVLKKTPSAREATAKNEWGIETIGAPEIWKYYNGTGAVVGSIDTGATNTHEAIKDNWRSDKGWFDPYLLYEEPYETDGHGSHTIGTMVGSHGIGVAPGAKWIACLGLYYGFGFTDALLACAQFMLCPTKPDGTDPDCSKAPHVVNNSWGGDDGYDPWFEDAVAVWKAAGIIPVFANSNAGPACATVGEPGGYNSVIGVGAVGSFDNEPNLLAYFSSKGPETLNGPAYIKPDVSAPGFWTRSVDASGNNTYIEEAGTSMATPHVSGVVALLKSVDPKLTYDQIYHYLTSTTDQAPLNTTEPTTWDKIGQYRNESAPGGPNCGGVKDTAWPNNRFGYGRVNVGTILRDGTLHDTRRSSC
ncbi:Suppressor of the cold-sensitive snRNP biogenesis mutant brr1-1 [Aphanomyces cochlioides]|nr:Suppressor of the cold-sensitive snRNP biogenesis mutant brr1-1 [Aphanomyces cochlioides]